jgi:hypothetical protein
MRGKLKAIGGSMSDEWNTIIANQTIQSFWIGNSDKDDLQNAALKALVGFKPKDEIEGMISAQLIGCHNAAMECYRRAMIRDQTFEGRQENLNQANKLSRTYSALVECLNRHRGKGQQKVTVEHVHVHEGGQAIVGNVQQPAEGAGSPKSEEQPHALAHAPSTPMPSTNTAREPLPVARHEERAMPDARRNVTGCAKGE